MALKAGREDENRRMAASRERLEAEQRRKERLIIAWATVIIAVLIGSVIGYTVWHNRASGTSYDALADCVSASGAAMYGTDWCPHCQDQKRLFGLSFKKVAYVNCDYSRECAERGVTGYPTWIFGDGSRQAGQLSLEELARRTNCTATLPATS